MKKNKKANSLNYKRPKRAQSIFREKPSDKILKTAISNLEKTVTDRLESKHRALMKKTELAAAAGAPLRSLFERDAKAVAAGNKLGKLFEAEQELRIRALQEKQADVYQFDIKVRRGTELFFPSYDLEWKSNTLLATADKKQGIFKPVALNRTGYSAAGLGVFLSSSVKARVRFSPFVSFAYDWTSLPMYKGPTLSQGGICVLGYANDKAKPFLDRELTLWDNFQPGGQWGTGDHESGLFGSALDTNNLILGLEAGDTVLLWMWCWVMTNVDTDGSFASGVIDCQMPFIVVETLPVFSPAR